MMFIMSLLMVFNKQDLHNYLTWSWDALHQSTELTRSVRTINHICLAHFMKCVKELHSQMPLSVSGNRHSRRKCWLDTGVSGGTVHILAAASVVQKTADTASHYGFCWAQLLQDVNGEVEAALNNGTRTSWVTASRYGGERLVTGTNRRTQSLCSVSAAERAYWIFCSDVE